MLIGRRGDLCIPAGFKSLPLRHLGNDVVLTLCVIITQLTFCDGHVDVPDVIIFKPVAFSGAAYQGCKARNGDGGGGDLLNTYYIQGTMWVLCTHYLPLY